MYLVFIEGKTIKYDFLCTLSRVLFIYMRSQNAMRARILIAILCIISTLQFGCYNTYRIELTELKSIQESDGESFKKIKTAKGQEITVTENSRVGVIDYKKDYHAISPFNFTLSDLQLVAPDEDLLLPRKRIKSANIKQINPTRTTMLILGAVAILAGGVVFAIVNKPECEGDFC